MKTIKIIITIVVSYLSPNPMTALTINVVRKVKNNEAPFKIPAT